MNQPLVTLEISAYNHEKYIEQAVLSLINQTYRNKEIIVIDDGSKDRTPEILNCLAKKHKFTFLQQENQGLAYTLNRMNNMANGKYIASCASDDFVPLDKIEKQVNFLENNIEFAVCGGNAIIVDKNGLINSSYTIEDDTFKVINFEDVFLHDRSIPAGTAMIRKDILDEIGGYSSEFPVEDKYMWLKITSKGYKIARINTVFQYYRQHENNISNNYAFIIENSKSCLEIYQTHPLYPIAINNFYAQTFNKFASIDRRQSIIALKQFNWRKLNKESLKQIFLGVLNYIKGLRN